MKQFTYTIKDPLGFHAGHTGLPAKADRSFNDTAVVFRFL